MPITITEQSPSASFQDFVSTLKGDRVFSNVPTFLYYLQDLIRDADMDNLIRKLNTIAQTLNVSIENLDIDMALEAIYTGIQSLKNVCDNKMDTDTDMNQINFTLEQNQKTITEYMRQVDDLKREKENLVSISNIMNNFIQDVVFRKNNLLTSLGVLLENYSRYDIENVEKFKEILLDYQKEYEYLNLEKSRVEQELTKLQTNVTNFQGSVNMASQKIMIIEKLISSFYKTIRETVKSEDVVENLTYLGVRLKALFDEKITTSEKMATSLNENKKLIEANQSLAQRIDELLKMKPFNLDNFTKTVRERLDRLGEYVEGVQEIQLVESTMEMEKLKKEFNAAQRVKMELEKSKEKGLEYLINIKKIYEENIQELSNEYLKVFNQVFNRQTNFYQGELDKYKRQIQEEMKEDKSIIESLNEAIRGYENSGSQENEQITRLNGEIANMKKNFNNLSKDHEALQINYDNNQAFIDTEIARHEKVVAGLKQDLAMNQIAIQNADKNKEDLSRITLENEKLKENIQLYKDEIARLKATLESQKNEYGGNQKQSIAFMDQLKEENARLMNEFTKEKNTVKNLTTEYDLRQKDISLLRQDISTHEAKIRTLEKQLAIETNRNETLKKEFQSAVDAKQKEINSIRVEYDKELNAILRAQLAKKQSELDAAKADLESRLEEKLSKQVGELKEIIAQEKAAKSALENNVGNLRKENEVLKNDILNKNQMLEETRGMITQKSNELKVATSEYHKQFGLAKEAREKNEELSRIHQQDLKTMQELRSNISTSNAHMTQFKEEIDSLKRSLNDIFKEKMKANQQVTAGYTKLVALVKHFTDGSERPELDTQYLLDLYNYRNKLLQYITELSKRGDQLQSEKEAFADTVENLEKNLQKEAETREILTEQCSDYQRLYTNEQEEMKKMEAEKILLKQEIDTLKVSNEQNLKNLQELEASHEKSRERLNREHNRKYKDLKTQLDTYKKLKESITNQLPKLYESIQSSNTQTVNIENFAVELDKFLTENTKIITQLKKQLKFEKAALAKKTDLFHFLLDRIPDENYKKGVLNFLQSGNDDNFRKSVENLIITSAEGKRETDQARLIVNNNLQTLKKQVHRLLDAKEPYRDLPEEDFYKWVLTKLAHKRGIATLSVSANSKPERIVKNLKKFIDNLSKIPEVDSNIISGLRAVLTDTPVSTSTMVTRSKAKLKGSSLKPSSERAMLTKGIGQLQKEQILVGGFLPLLGTLSKASQITGLVKLFSSDTLGKSLRY